VKVVFLPGLAADETMSRYHDLPGHESIWIRWPKSIRPDWDAFLGRVIAENPVEAGDRFVGISFGGLVAMRLAARIPPDRIILVGSLRSRAHVTPMLRWPPWAAAGLPRFAFDLSRVPDAIISRFFGIAGGDHLAHFRAMAAGFPPADIRAMAQLALRPGRMPERGIPVRSVHGDRDRLLPADLQAVDHRVAGGGHLISMTHSGEVNRKLLEWLR
jgi:pimeloyl-ACP methyl ester carboxylesterase